MDTIFVSFIDFLANFQLKFFKINFTNFFTSYFLFKMYFIPINSIFLTFKQLPSYNILSRFLNTVYVATNSRNMHQVF